MSRSFFVVLSIAIALFLLFLSIIHVKPTEGRAYCPRPAGTYNVDGLTVTYNPNAPAHYYYTTNGVDPIVINCVRTVTGGQLCSAP